jgi:hypothetical protein
MRISYPERIHERVEELGALERQLHRKPTSARVQMLRRLNSGAAISLPACVPLVGLGQPIDVQGAARQACAPEGGGLGGAAGRTAGRSSGAAGGCAALSQRAVAQRLPAPQW